MIQYETKNPKDVVVNEIFYNKNTNSLCYKNFYGIIINLESPNINVENILTSSIYYSGFRINDGIIKSNIVLPDNSNISYTGPLIMADNFTLTVPIGTTLTIN